MTKTNSLKRALFASVFSIVICFAMLVGSTFAWFTDTATISGNKIQSGKLDIELYKVEYKSNMGEVLSRTEITDSTAPLFTYENWEPGYVEFVNLQVVNAGTLAAKWQASIAPTTEIGKLAEVIEVYVAKIPVGPGKLFGVLNGRDNTFNGYNAEYVGMLDELAASQKAIVTSADENSFSMGTFAILFKMSEEANNDYQDETAGTFDIRIVATQATAESDSFDNTYDEDAIYPEVPSTSAELSKAVADAEDGQTIKLAKNTTYEVGNFALGNKSINIEGEEGTVLKPIANAASDYAAITVMGSDGATLTVSNVNIIGSNNSDGSRGICFSGQQNQNATLVVNNCRFSNVTTGIFLGGVANAKITNSTFNNCIAAIGGTETLSGTLTVENCTFNDNSENIGWAGSGKLIIKNSPTCTSFVQYPAGTVTTVTGGNYAN